MTNLLPRPGQHVVAAKTALAGIFTALKAAGYTLVGPTVREEAIVYDQIETPADLPLGWTDDQGPGRYRLRERGDGQLFGFVVGPTSAKRFLYPPSLTLFTTHQNGRGFRVEASREVQPTAFIGLRACDLAAVAVQDRVFLEGPYQDPNYKARRERAFILAVNCTEPGETCFCASMGSGPRCSAGFDLALTELADSAANMPLVLQVGSELGAQMLAGCDWRLAGAFELDQARKLMDRAEGQMGRALETGDLPDLLLKNLDHPHWDVVAGRCLSCTNCTMVCPTCFCSDVQDVSDLTGQETARVRTWDSCFNPDFSYVHGGNLRPSTRARYRQWLTHKLASWQGQFGVLGCVGCGRCITWCPAGIDLTEEVAAIRE